ncbi:hypothetical protein IC620_05390 [Hazenella sp. IB182357]|uniref:Uncharacterized protein n=1 Tax=Polycladospora coralii TaxID=2771432 RepID=A0A926RTV0_9BACL|nr:hypothetical protein [Polycladospora coralii]MBD1371792.1 hypothetical protein [Polycladospora coralii]MBS7529253.1 hypothetical protein [Polycladospora coralii]
MNVVKSVVRKTYRSVMFLSFLSVLLLSTVLLLAFLANPQEMYNTIQSIFGIQ